MYDSFQRYLEHELMRYVKEAMDDGATVEQIRAALLRRGHHQSIVDESIRALQRVDFDIEKASREVVQVQTLHGELYAEVMGSMLRYIDEEQKKGFTIKEIREVLISHGHNEGLIDAAIGHAVNDTVFEEKRSPLQRFMFFFAIVLVCLAIVVVAAVADEKISLVAMGFFPALASVILLAVLSPVVGNRQKIALWLIPFVLGAVFYAFATSGSSPALAKMDILPLTVVNIAVSLVVALFLIGPPPQEERPEPMEDMRRVREPRKEKPKKEPLVKRFSETMRRMQEKQKEQKRADDTILDEEDEGFYGPMQKKGMGGWAGG
jgi:hypothetical protein